MGCLTDPNPLGFLGQDTLVFCDLTVEQAVVGAPLRVRISAHAGTKNVYGVSDTFAGVITEISANGTPLVVDLIRQASVSVQVGSTTINNGANPVMPFTLQSDHAIAPDLAGRQLHVSIGPANYFRYSIGEHFQANSSAMLRTTFTVPRPAATSSFNLSVSRISSGISASAVPTATISVSNLGTGSGIDAITGITTDSQGTIVGKWTTSDSPLIPPGNAQPVSLRMNAAPGSQYAGKTLTATFTDTHGNHAQATFSIAAASGTGTPPPTQSPPPTTTPPTTPTPSSFPWLLVGGVAVAGTGLTALYLSGRR